jgi:ribosomal peptide maturation radical SAM protein 1
MEIAFVNMPFAAAMLPSLALTQLKSILQERFDARVSSNIHYLNHDFVHYMGLEFYLYMSGVLEAQNTGLGDWLFRQVAFPHLPDNTAPYLKRFFPYKTPQHMALRRQILEKRDRLDGLLDSLIDKYRLDQSNVVGFTSMFNQNIASFALAKKLKDRNPKIEIVMGGANCEAPMGVEIAKHVPQIDFVFSGPALKSFPEFIQCMLDGEPERRHAIKGVFSKSHAATECGSAAVGEELEINVPIHLDYDHFMTSFRDHFPDPAVKPILLFETSRGCWWGQRAHCTFCGLNGTTMAYRRMNSDVALDQFKHLFKYADRVTRFESVDNIMPKEYLSEVFPALETPQGSYLFYEVKADLTASDMEVLSKARVRTVQPGIEALASSTLKLMKKGTTSFQNLAFLKNCLLYDILPVWNLLVGFPGEEEAVYKKYVKDLPLLVHLPPPSGSFPVRFDRYSPYFMKAQEYGLDLHPVDYYEFSYALSEESLANLAYFFEDRNLNAKYMNVMIKWLDQLRMKVSQWTARFHGLDKLQPAKLYFKHDSIIYDSRSGRAVEYDVGERCKMILDLISTKPARLGAIAAHLGDGQDADVTDLMASLQSKSLLFEEEGRYLSLLLPKEPLKLSVLPHE